MAKVKTAAILQVFVILLWAGAASAQTQPRIDVQLDRNPVQVGESFAITIQIDTKGNSEPEVRLPALAGLRVLSRSESHPMSFSFSFGLGSGGTRKVSRQSVYELIVVADRPGEYRIDPVVVSLDGRQYKSAAKSIRVLGSAASGSAVAADPGDEPRVNTQPVQPGDLSSEDLRGAKVDPDYFVQTHISKTEAVVGERLVLTVYAFFSHNVSGIELVREPGTEGFWVENLMPTGARPQVEQVSIGGVSYGRVAQRRIAIFPVEPGKITIAPAVAEYTAARGFFSTPKTVRRAGVPVTVEVSPIPTADQPVGFVAANVGRFTFSVEMDREAVKIGEPITLTMTVKGEGNVRNVVLPTVGEVRGFKSYAPELGADVRIEGDVVLGTRTSKTLLIAKEPGQFTIPALSFVYFDPTSGKYETITVPERAVDIANGAASSLAPAQTPQARSSREEPLLQTGLERLNRQLRSISSSADFSVAAPGSAPGSLWFLLLAVGAPLAYGGFLTVAFVRRRRVQASARDKSKRADTEALRRLAELGRGNVSLDSGAFFSELARILTHFLEDRLEDPVSGDTLPELRERLVHRGFEPALADKVVAEMESLDFARFARAAGGAQERGDSLVRLRKLVAELAAVRLFGAGGQR